MFCFCCCPFWDKRDRFFGSLTTGTYVCVLSIAAVSLSKKLYSHCSSLPSCMNGDLVLTMEAAHPAVTSMGIGKANVKLLSMSAYGCGSGGTLNARTIILGMVQPHLRSSSVLPDGFASTGS